MPGSSEMLELLRRAAQTQDVIGLAGGLPAEMLLPRAALARAVTAATTASTEALQYGWPEGDPKLRAWIADELEARGAAVTADDIIVTSGAQQALALAAAALPAGARIAVRPETYPAALDAFTAAGATAVPGIDDASADARYVIAGVDNPRGVDLLDDDPAQRAAVLAGDATIIADEAYVRLRFDGRLPRPLIADARDRVWHVGTVSKILSPGLRVGWLVPPPAAREAVLAAKSAADLQTGSLAQAALVSLLHELDIDVLVARACAVYDARCAALVEALRAHLPDARFATPEGGFSIWLELGDLCPSAAAELQLLACAVESGVCFDPGSMFRRGGATSPLAVRLSFSHVPPEAMDEAARRLAFAVERWRRDAARAA